MLDLTQQEKEALLKLIDIAVKSPQGGLAVSGAATVLAQKIQASMQAEENLPEFAVVDEDGDNE